ncbi:hypothetical protein EST38_g10148 [Candolleomyces aberdarensis]|uniref:Uncharacterized protein n=1 Tax=Candolleomyces aberdarensis TaxID=2316362 RepID=A0A4Q2D9U9_9AGAR|nr:hypothetical protein EST38_g10148 [Candolleomyces aberdarensis]
MRARIDLVITTLKYVSTHDAVSTSLSHLLDMLRLCRSDNLGVRDMIPNLYLRLHQDQQCYDFIKWYATEGNRSDYDWGDMSLAFLDLENEDPLESEGLENMFCRKWSVAHAIPALLIQLRVLLDLKDFLASFALYDIVEKEKLNFDTVRTIQDSLPNRSSILSSSSLSSSSANGTRAQELLKQEGMEDRIKELEKQTDKIFRSVHGGNKYFWKALVQWEQYMDMGIESYSHGTMEEVIVLLLNNARSWAETLGSLDWVKEKFEEL